MRAKKVETFEGGERGAQLVTRYRQKIVLRARRGLDGRVELGALEAGRGRVGDGLQEGDFGVGDGPLARVEESQRAEDAPARDEREDGVAREREPAHVDERRFAEVRTPKDERLAALDGLRAEGRPVERERLRLALLLGRDAVRRDEAQLAAGEPEDEDARPAGGMRDSGDDAQAPFLRRPDARDCLRHLSERVGMPVGRAARVLGKTSRRGHTNASGRRVWESAGQPGSECDPSRGAMGWAPWGA